MTELDNKNTEILTILQEECAEVIQAASKIKRFGIHSVNPTTKKSNLEILTQEISDTLCLIDLLVENLSLDQEVIQEGKNQKLAKLKKFSFYLR